MDAEDRDMQRRGMVVEIWAARRWILASILSFAAAAVLALLFVGPRYETRSLLRIEGAAAVDMPGLVAHTRTDEFADDLAARLDDDPTLSRAARLPDRLVAILDGVPSRASPSLDEAAIAERVSIRRGNRDDEVEITTLGASPGSAAALAGASAAGIGAWLAAGGGPDRPSMPADTAALDIQRGVVAALEEELNGLALDETAIIDERRTTLEGSSRDVARSLQEAEAMLAFLQTLGREPGAQGDLGGLDEDLASRIAGFRAFSASVEDLRDSLPQGNPRLEVADLRRDQLGREVAALARSAAAGQARAVEGLRFRLDEVHSELAGLREEIATRRAIEVQRTRLTTRLATERNRLEALEAADAQAASAAPEPAPVVPTVVSEQTGRIAPPFALAASVAGLAGLLVGCLGSAAHALAARRRHTTASVDAYGSEATAGEEPEPEERTGAIRSELVSLWEEIDAGRGAQADAPPSRAAAAEGDLATASTAGEPATMPRDAADPGATDAASGAMLPADGVEATRPGSKARLSRLSGLLRRAGRVPSGPRPSIEDRRIAASTSIRSDMAEDADGHDAITVAEAASALLASKVSRALIVAVDENTGAAASLALARLLAADGQLVLLIDLAESQTAASQAGLPIGAMGFREVAARALGFSSVTVSDAKSTADIVAGGQRPGDLPSGTAVSEALRFARRAYDHVIVDCGSLSAAQIVTLADENCAVLLATGGPRGTDPADRLRELQATGLDTALLRG